MVERLTSSSILLTKVEKCTDTLAPVGSEEWGLEVQPLLTLPSAVSLRDGSLWSTVVMSPRASVPCDNK